MKRLSLALAGLLGASAFTAAPLLAADIDYPQVIRTHYEAADPKAGGQFVIWSEREKIYYGLDPRLYPPVKSVEITQVTPTAGSVTLTFIELKTIISQTSDYLYLTGNVRFRVSAMTLDRKSHV